MFSYLGKTADIIGIISGILALIAWYKSKKYALEAKKTLVRIQAYREIELLTEISSSLDFIKAQMRKTTPKTKTKPSKTYEEIENKLSDILSKVPTKHRDIIDKLEGIEKEIRIARDNENLIINEKQYSLLESITYVKNRIKTTIEKLANE